MRFPLSLTLSLSRYIAQNRIAKRSRFPLVLMLEPLHTCNLSCSGCGRIREYSATLGKTMPVEKCLDVSKECGAPIVSICGGEPLIYPDIGELVSRLVEMGRHIYLCTNALKLKDSLDTFKPSTHLFFNVHLDGQADSHDAIVCRKGTFATAIAAITEAKRRGFQVTTNTTVYRETDMQDIESLLNQLSKLQVDSHMIAPGYDYESVKNGDLFLTRSDTLEKFKQVGRLARFPLSNTPIYLDFLKGERDLPCAAWGNPTRNPVGWRSPCYMLADRHYATFKELMDETDWDSYGPGRDERCADCMVHCGFEPSAVLGPETSISDLLRMAAWQMR
jgi:hopanoid biosynthesis associated radical SAM protein HpnH